VLVGKQTIRWDSTKLPDGTTPLPDGTYAVSLELVGGNADYDAIDRFKSVPLQIIVDNEPGPATDQERIPAIGFMGYRSRWAESFVVDWVRPTETPLSPTAHPYPYKHIDPPRDPMELVGPNKFFSETWLQVYNHRYDPEGHLSQTQEGHRFIVGYHRRLSQEKDYPLRFPFTDGQRNQGSLNKHTAFRPDPRAPGFICISWEGRLFRFHPTDGITTLAGHVSKLDIVPYSPWDRATSIDEFESYQWNVVGTFDSIERFWQSTDLAIDPENHDIIYVADAGNQVIRKVDLSSTVADVTTFAGTIKKAGYQNGSRQQALFDSPQSIQIINGILYVADYNNNALRAINLTTGNVTAVINSGPALKYVSPANNAKDVSPTALLKLTFNEVVKNAGTGKIKIYTSNGVEVESISATDASRVSGIGTSAITIDSNTKFSATTPYYYINIENTAFSDGAGSYFGGISDSTTWHFTAGDTIETTPSNFPVYDKVNGVVNPNWVRRFSNGTLALQENTYRITSIQPDDGTIIKTIVVRPYGSPFDVDWRGVVGPVDDIFANGRYRYVEDGDYFERWETHALSRLCFANKTAPIIAYDWGTIIYGAEEGAYAISLAVDDEEPRIIQTAQYQWGVHVYRPIQYDPENPGVPLDPLQDDINVDLSARGRAHYVFGTIKEFYPNKDRPSLSVLHGRKGHNYAGQLNFDDMMTWSDAQIAWYIRGGMKGHTPPTEDDLTGPIARPELTGRDVAAMIYFIRVHTLQGKTEAIGPVEIALNLREAGLWNDVADGTQPVISQVSVGVVDGTTRSVTFTTNEDTVACIQYGRTTNYGLNSSISDEYKKTHTIILRDLDPDHIDEIHYQVRAKDQAGNQEITPDALLGDTGIDGDVDGDGDVDIFDLFAVASAFGTVQGDAGYNPACDFDGDGDVDINDLYTCGSNFGVGV